MRYIKSYLISENVQQAKLFLSKRGIDINNIYFNKIRKMLSNNGYVFWFTKRFFEDKVPFEELENIWNIIKSNPQIISKFSKPVVNLENIEKFWDEYNFQKTNSNVKSIYNEFPSEQKGLIDLSNEKHISLLNDLYKDKDKLDFIKKISRYHNRQSLINSLDLFINNKTDKKFEDLVKSLNDNEVDIIYSNKENDIIICTVDYNQLKMFGSDTSWCIVGSEHTFKSYNSEDFSRQFIIFLLDEVGLRSKIGVTTSINGYKTAHFKNDNYCGKEELDRILKSRGVDILILYPTKEAVINVDWTFIKKDMLKHIGFTEEEILEKKRTDVGKKNWDNLSVEFLIESGFTKEEIISRKKLFGINPNSYKNENYKKRDFEFFTKDEIIKFGLIDKTIMSLSELQIFTKQEIIDKKMIDRANIKLIDLEKLGFNFEEIRDFAKKDKFKGDELALIRGKSRRNIISIVKKISKWDETSLKDNLLLILKLKRDEIAPLELIELYNVTKNFSNPLAAIQHFSKIYSNDLKKDDILALLKCFYGIGYAHSLINLSSLISLNIYPEYSTELIMGLLSKMDEMKDYTVLSHDNMNTLKRNLDKNPDIYELIYNKIKSNINKLLSSSNLYNLKVFVNGNFSLRGTIESLIFWNIKDIVPLEKLSTIFWNIKVSECDLLLKYLKDNYDISGKSGYNFFKNCLYSRDEITTLIFCIKNSIYVENCYEMLLDILEEKSNQIDIFDIEEIESIINNIETYKSRWNNILKKDSLIRFIKDTNKVAQYYWGSSSSKYNPDTWYKECWPIISEFLSTESKYNYISISETLIQSTAIILSGLGKMEELKVSEDKIIVDNTGNSFFNKNPLKDLVKIVADKHITNSRRTWKKLTYEERKSIYEWLNNFIKKYEKNFSERKNYIFSLMSVDWYIFDKKRFWEYIDYVVKLRNNISVGKTKKTIRLKEIKGLIVYLTEEGKFDDIKTILSKIKLGKVERKNSMNVFQFDYFFNSRKEGDDLSSKEAREKHTKMFDKIMNDFLKEPKNESFLVSWKDFNLKYY